MLQGTLCRRLPKQINLIANRSNIYCIREVLFIMLGRKMHCFGDECGWISSLCWGHTAVTWYHFLSICLSIFFVSKTIIRYCCFAWAVCNISKFNPKLKICPVPRPSLWHCELLQMNQVIKVVCPLQAIVSLEFPFRYAFMSQTGSEARSMS